MTARRTERAALAVALAAAVATASAGPAGGALSQPTRLAPKPVPFVATYTILWHGVPAGSSTLELHETAPQSYLYTSTDSAYGFFRLAFPHPLRQSSRFRIAAGEVEPLDFQTAGAGNAVMAQFDWKIGQVTGMAKGKLLDLKLQPGTQDPLSVQIAIMLKLQARDAPDAFWMLNSDEIDRFQYVRHEETTLDTPLGKLRTILYTSHEAGSDKTTYLWLAPALDYMPARAEQHVKDNTQVSLEIRAFARK
ncbi:MAG TPA: DUF3108 domain-containing protein [Steroidobacteraceae bacterium]|jgi:hypothetical protein|nr:DUF3108 domain-containing protein [Steroidobacteraceae bacterium]